MASFASGDESNEMEALLRARLRRFYAAYQPEKLEDESHFDKLVAKVGGGANEKKNSQLFSMLVKKYGPEPEDELEAASEDDAEEEEEESAEDALRKRLERFYGAYQPEKLDDPHHINKLMSKIGDATNENKVNSLFGMLVKKYGPEPDEADENDDSAPMSPEAALRKRLERFYAAYQPEKLDDPKHINKLMDKIGDASNENKVNSLFGMLVKKYGPEPEEEGNEGECEEEEEEEEEEPKEDEYGLGLPRVLYCPVDGLPPEYCEYGPSFDEALPWLAKRCPDLVLTTKSGATVEDYALARKAGDLSLDEDVGKKKNKRGKGILGKGKKKNKGDAKVTIEAVKRGKRKFVTVITGLDACGVKVKKASKALSKKFAGSASTGKLPSGLACINVQGDCVYELPDFLVEEFGVEKDKIFILAKKKLSPAFPQ